MAGSGRPAGAGRSGGRPTAGTGASITGSVISDWFTRDWPSLPPAGRCTSSGRVPSAVRTNLHLPDIPLATRCRACFRSPDQAPGTGPRADAVSRQHDTSTMATMDPDPIPTEPTTDPEPPDADIVRATVPPRPGVLRRPVVDAGRRSVAWPSGLALVLTFSVGIGVGSLAAPARGRRERHDPGPTDGPRRELRADPRGLGDPPPATTSAPTSSTTRRSSTARSTGLTEAVGDTGHTSFLTPEERAERVRGAVRLVRRDRRPDRRGRGRPPADRRRLPRQPGRSGRPGTRRHHRGGRWPADAGPRPRRGRELDPRRGRIDGARDRPARDRRRAERELSIVRAEVAVETVSWAMVPGSKTAMLRLEQFSHGAADDLKAALERDPRGRCRSARLRPPRQSRRLRQRGGRRCQPVPAEGTVFVERDAEGKETTHPGLARRRRHATCRWSCSSMADGELGGDRVGRAPGRRRGPAHRR